MAKLGGAADKRFLLDATMKQPSLSAVHRRAAKNLEDSLRQYEQAPSDVAREFLDLKLQATIFQYDVCAEMVNFARNKPTGFAASVALKGLVLRLYEYDDLLNTTFIPRLIALAELRGIPFDRASVKAARYQWKNDLSRLKKWAAFRNQVAGHYGKDLRLQVKLLKELQPDEVMSVTTAFLSFNMALLQGLRDAGQSVASVA